MLSRYAPSQQDCLHEPQVGEQAPAPDNEAVQVREHPGGWYAAGENPLVNYSL